MTKKYYLETNSLRKLNNDLNSIQNNCFTSGLSIFELISGISQTDFRIRKSVITNLFESKIPIVWELPNTLIARAFPPIDFIDHKSKGLKKLCEELINHNNLTEFKNATDNVKYNLEYYRKLDDFYSKRFINATIKGNKNLKAILQEQNSESLTKLSKEFIKKLPQMERLNQFMTLLNIVDDMVNGIELQLNKKNIDRNKIYDNYNGSINIYIEAFSLFTATKSAELNQPAKNDFIDLSHLLYLKNSVTSYIVTDDKMILDINEQSITTENFKTDITNKNGR